MSRLTKYHTETNGARWISIDCDAECAECAGCDNIRIALNRLAAYEDTGLEPEEVAELAQAKADGRLVVLPCKVGDTVYALPYYPAYWVDIEETKITGVTQFPDKKGVSNQIVTSCCLCYEWEQDIGKTIFLTREEAEAALKGAE